VRYGVAGAIERAALEARMGKPTSPLEHNLLLAARQETAKTLAECLHRFVAVASNNFLAHTPFFSSMAQAEQPEDSEELPPHEKGVASLDAMVQSIIEKLKDKLAQHDPLATNSLKGSIRRQQSWPADASDSEKMQALLESVDFHLMLNPEKSETDIKQLVLSSFEGGIAIANDIVPRLDLAVATIYYQHWLHGTLANALSGKGACDPAKIQTMELRIPKS
jgi:hypothetical protein